MNFKIYLYSLVRVTLGVLLVSYSLFNAIKYSVFLERLDGYFSKVSVFDIDFIEALAPLVPFEEFVIGFFLILGMFTRKVLIISILLFAFFTLFLLDADHFDLAFLHLFLCLIAILLLNKNKYDLDAVVTYRAIS